MVTLTIVVRADSFHIVTDAPLAEVVPLVDQWYAAIAAASAVADHLVVTVGTPTEQPNP